MLQRMPDWAAGEKVLPMMELIATIALAAPGADGRYRGRIAESAIETWLKCARAHRTMLVLNLQPGRATFLDEVTHYERWLREPDVGLALDPEWAVGPEQVPGKVFGHTTGDEINEVAQWLSRVVRQHDLPQKPLIYHILRPSIISDEAALTSHPGIALVKSVDGIGGAADKEQTYREVMRGTPATAHAGFKLFFQEDAAQGPLMTPSQVLALVPRPDYVVYE
ncbi:hypothetical protein [Leekyejoonella antrihumi]|nr:hypothetical protein [Leekyejoonella antrihumi]